MTPRQLRGTPDVVARRMLGAHLRVGDVLVRLVEIEAYGGYTDPASHAFRGERVANRTMFGPPGRLYVYTSHGIHTCANVTCGSPEVPAAVLLRGAVVLEGLETVRERRGRAVPRALLDGPGKLCQALGITRADDGLDLFGPVSRAELSWERPVPAGSIVAGPRVGLTKETERPWRFRLLV